MFKLPCDANSEAFCAVAKLGTMANSSAKSGAQKPSL